MIEGEMRKLKKKGKEGVEAGWCKRKGMAVFGSSDNAREVAHNIKCKVRSHGA